jgi:NAD(P)-dependent dehydrogenase (short-subunit alcohol dehydrogenase family)
VISGHERASVEETTTAFRAAGHDVCSIRFDVSDPAEVQSAVDCVAGRWGGIDVVFANAGIHGTWSSIEELEPEEWDHVMNTNLRGTYLTVKYAIPYMKVRGGAIIINSSINGSQVFSNAGATAYSTAKAGQVAFAKMAALELAADRIRVNVICPGWIATTDDSSDHREANNRPNRFAIFPNGRIPLTDGAPGTPDDVSQVVLFLASDLSKHLTGTEIRVDGGEALLMG